MNYVRKLNQKHALLLLTAIFTVGAFGATVWAMQAGEASLSPTAPASEGEHHATIPSMAVIEGVTFRGEAFLVQPGQKATLMPDKESPEFQAAVGQPFIGDGQSIEIAQATTLSISSKSLMNWSVPAGAVRQVDESVLEWTAPLAPGNYLIELQIVREEICYQEAGGQETVLGSVRESVSTSRFMMLVQYPYDRDGDGQLAGLPVGIYPNEDAENVNSYVAVRRELYKPPKWFVKLTPEVANLRISQHFRLGDFAPDVDLAEGPAFIVISFRLIERLETMIAELRARGHEVETLKIVRGFLTPIQQQRLNRRGANLTDFSRHIYGDAAVLFVDVDGDGLMDDLNRDGKVDIDDADFMYQIVERIERQVQKFGGLGKLAKPSDSQLPQTPCIALDMRGSRARW
jgi:hypothetical protein